MYLFTLTVGQQIVEDLILDDADAYSLVDDRKRVSYISITQRSPMQIKGSRNVSHNASRLEIKLRQFSSIVLSFLVGICFILRRSGILNDSLTRWFVSLSLAWSFCSC